MITIGKQLTPVVGVLAQTSGNWLPGFQKMRAFSDKFQEGWDHEMDVFNLRANLALTPTYSYTRADCPQYGELKGPSCRNRSADRGASGSAGSAVAAELPAAQGPHAPAGHCPPDRTATWSRWVRR